MRWRVVPILCFASMLAWAQESKLGADFRRESERMKEACGSFSFKAVPSCAYGLFTDHPLHVAAGSLPPQNGFGLGLAFVTEEHTPNWRISWDVDAVSAVSVMHAPSGAWRAGGYMKFVHTPKEKITVSVPEPGEPAETTVAVPRLSLHPNTVFNVYAQAISLNTVEYFGLGNTTTLAGDSVFGMSETIVGGSVVKPIFEVPALRWLNLSLRGEVNGRFVDIRGQHGQSVPSIETLYTDATAPGLSSQPGFVQFGEGVRIRPMITDRFQFDYLAKFEQFVAPGSSENSFRRWTIDLKHTLYLYGHTGSQRATEALGPDTCASGGAPCPPVSYSRNRNGSISVRLLLSESIAGAGSAVPFYFQQTLGGSDIDGAMALASYRDYRFRAPNVLLLQESFEHSIWGPFGIKLMADQGRVALTRGDVGFSHLKHSFAGGLTLRAGSFPYVNLMFAWGGPEGHHNIFAMDNNFLGSSARPSLY
jgi:hypothetical protein